MFSIFGRKPDHPAGLYLTRKQGRIIEERMDVIRKELETLKIDNEWHKYRDAVLSAELNMLYSLITICEAHID